MAEFDLPPARAADSRHTNRTCICLANMLTILTSFCGQRKYYMATGRSGTVPPSAAYGQRSSSVTRRTPAVRKRTSARINEDEIYRRIYGAVLDHRLQPGTKLK